MDRWLHPGMWVAATRARTARSCGGGGSQPWRRGSRGGAYKVRAWRSKIILLFPQDYPTMCPRMDTEVEGDYQAMAVMPPEREDAESTPWIRCRDVAEYLQNLFCPRDLGKALRCVCKHFVLGKEMRPGAF